MVLFRGRPRGAASADPPHQGDRGTRGFQDCFNWRTVAAQSTSWRERHHSREGTRAGASRPVRRLLVNTAGEQPTYLAWACFPCAGPARPQGTAFMRATSATWHEATLSEASCRRLGAITVTPDSWREISERVAPGVGTIYGLDCFCGCATVFNGPHSSAWGGIRPPLNTGGGRGFGCS